MAYKVRYTPRALGDLDGIFEYIAPENPRAALTVKARIRDRIESLAQFPASGPETAERGLRMLPVGRYPYLIFYEIDEAAKAVAIVHIRHASRKR
jgi:addiction module RelE/StbE family toxin